MAIIVVASVQLFIAPLQAATTVSLPLEGRYRPGRFMPVRVSVAGDTGTITVRADGAVPTVIENAQQGETIVPFLAVTESIPELRLEGVSPAALRPLAENERLVAFAGAEADSAKALFPGATLVPIPLDLTRPLLDPPQAWSGLDAVILSPAARTRLTDGQIDVLLAAGVALIVPDGQRPDSHWPWKRSGEAWLLRHDIAGPTSLVVPEAYAPTYTWDRGLPAASRRQIVLVAIVFCILAVAVALWRSRWVTAALLLLCAITAAAVIAKYLRQSPQLLMQKTIAVRDAHLTQYDNWAWRASLREGSVSHPAYPLTVPIFTSMHQIEASQIRLNCNAQGKPLAYELRLEPGQSMAFLTRTVAPTFPMQSFAPAVQPWKDFALDLYAGQGDQLAGEAPIAAEGSATVINRSDGR